MASFLSWLSSLWRRRSRRHTTTAPVIYTEEGPIRWYGVRPWLVTTVRRTPEGR